VTTPLSPLSQRVLERIDKIARGDAGVDSSSVDAHSRDYPPLTRAAIDAAEARLGFAVPKDVRELYEQIGNGGFGPAYGLLGLAGGALQEEGLDAVGVYERNLASDPDDPLWIWPPKLLPLVHLGCAMFLCVDCGDAGGRVVWFEPNGHEFGQPYTHAFVPTGRSFRDIMLGWAAGEEVTAVLEASWETSR
jgi:SMI1/KNR4 family protein SUKH-1